MTVRWRTLLQRRLLIRVSVPALIGLVQIAVAGFEIASGHASIGVLWWAAPALLIGYGFGRMTRIAWEDTRSQICLVGGQLLLWAVYFIFKLGARIAVHHSPRGVNPAEAAVVVLVVSFGLFLGRSLGLTRQTQRALTSESRSSATPANATIEA